MCVCGRFTYEIAPVFTLIEDVILTKMRQLVGWDDGDGIFAPGMCTIQQHRTIRALCYEHDVRPSVRYNFDGMWSRSATNSGNRQITG